MKKYPWFKMWPSIWLSDPHLKHCKWDAKGLLADLMCLAHHGTPRGTVTNGGSPLTVRDISKTFSESYKKTSRLMDVLLKLNRIGFTPASLCSQSESKQKNTVEQKEGIWFIPSMVREAQQAEKAYKDGLKGGNPNLLNTLNLPLNPTLNPEGEVEAEEDVDVERGDNPSGPPGFGRPGASGKEERIRETVDERRERIVRELHESEKRKARGGDATRIGDMLPGPTGTTEPDEKETAPETVETPEAGTDTSPGMGLV